MNQQIEFEIKVLDVDLKKLRTGLKAKGFTKKSDLSFRRYIFNTVASDPSEWIRLRTDGSLTTLTYKKSVEDSIDGMVEIEIKVDDFDKTKNLLESAGLTYTSYQENKRELYVKDNVEVSIDSWPLIPPYVEIESIDEQSVKAALKLLALEKNRTTSLSTGEVYKLFGENIDEHKILKFK